MSLRIPDPNSMPSDDGKSAVDVSMLNPFASGPGGFLAPEELESKPNRFGGAVVLLLVAVTAGGVLFGMRRLGMGPKLSLAEIKIDYPLDSDPLTASGDHERILSDLQSNGNVHRIPLEMVQTNPFAWRSLIQKETPAAKEQNAEELTRRQEEERKQKIRGAAGTLVVNSLLGGQVPMARIDGQLVRVGDRVGEFFTVRSISGRVVELECEGEVFSLTMGEPEEGSPGRKGGGRPRR
ncbi:MAG: hypothetical protein JNK58_12585 [Phycisphaerae bacterium]|nr:hypothetical protein [Phycisphaerae bacterium]